LEGISLKKICAECGAKFDDLGHNATICEECADQEIEAPPEMTAEHWENEERELTAYGYRDEYGGL